MSQDPSHNTKSTDEDKVQQKWKSMKNVEKLQQEGYKMEVRLIEERKHRQYLEKLHNDLYDHAAQCMKTIEILQVQERRTVNISNSMYKNFKNLTTTIENLSCKNNGKPLNNEMAQVVQIIKNVKQKHKNDVTNIVKQYQLDLSQLDKQSK